MKRNKVMRAASAILVLAVLTTCIFSGTMAKYIISDYTTDSARVAKFGVVVTASGDLFGPSYAKTANTIQKWTETGTNAESVAAFDAETTLVVAPGTKNEKGMTLAVSGKPEVSTRLIIDAPENAENADFANTDVYLNVGAYSVMVQVDVSKTTITKDNKAKFVKMSDAQTFAPLTGTDFETNGALKSEATTRGIYKKVQLTGGTNTTMSGVYKPIAWSVKNAAGTATACADVAAVNAAVITAVTNGTTGAATTAGVTTATMTPNETYSGSATITWEWEFTDGAVWTESNTEVIDNWENTTVQDLEDTVLGQMIALAESTEAPTTYKIASGNALVNYTNVPAVSGSANNVYVAYTGASAPTAADDSSVIACLTASYGARVTVEQVD